MGAAEVAIHADCNGMPAKRFQKLLHLENCLHGLRKGNRLCGHMMHLDSCMLVQ